MNNETTNNQTQTNQKTKIYNIIILDKSGSMSCIRNGVISGYNELIDSIRSAAQENAATQEHNVTFVTFNEHPELLYRELEADKTTAIDHSMYVPCGCTALYDAMGYTLTEAERVVDQQEDAIGVVTVITDGYENASRHFSGSMIGMLVSRLKEKGWTFAFMGTNINVAATASTLKIEHTMEFKFTDQGMNESWLADRDAKMRHYQRMNAEHDITSKMSKNERLRYYRQREQEEEYFKGEKDQK